MNSTHARQSGSGVGQAALALGAALLLSGLAGCGGGSGGGTVQAGNLPVALRHLVAARTGVVSTRYLIFAPGQVVPPILGVTRFDNAVKRLEIKLDLRPFMSLYQPSLPPSSRVGKVRDWRFDVITDNSHSPVMYLSSPLFEEPSFQKKLPARVRNKPWMKLDLVEALLQGGSVGQVTAFLPKGASPAGFVTALSGHATSEKGERIDGVETNRYAEQVNFRGHVKELPGFIQKVLAGSAPVMHALVWVDGSSNVRRIRLSSRPLRQLQGGVVTATMNFRDLGSKVNVDLPPKSEVFDAMQLPP